MPEPNGLDVSSAIPFDFLRSHQRLVYSRWIEIRKLLTDKRYLYGHAMSVSGQKYSFNRIRIGERVARYLNATTVLNLARYCTRVALKRTVPSTYSKRLRLRFFWFRQATTVVLLSGFSFAPEGKRKTSNKSTVFLLFRRFSHDQSRIE